MENRRTGGKFAAILLILMLISCCFLGSTFAKYTSAQNGSSKTSVAKWRITNISENSPPAQNLYTLVGKTLSPAIEETEGGYVNQIVFETIEIQNLSEVKAKIVIEDTTRTYYEWTDNKQEALKPEAYVGSGITYGTDSTVLTKETLDKVFTITYMFTKGGNAAVANKIELDVNEKVNLVITLTWTTQKLEGITPVKYDDALDTAIGMYIGSVQETFVVSATQVSKTGEQDKTNYPTPSVTP